MRRGPIVSPTRPRRSIPTVVGNDLVERLARAGWHPSFTLGTSSGEDDSSLSLPITNGELSLSLHVSFYWTPGPYQDADTYRVSLHDPTLGYEGHTMLSAPLTEATFATLGRDVLRAIKAPRGEHPDPRDPQPWPNVLGGYPHLTSG